MAKIGIAASQITGQAASGGGGGTTVTTPFFPPWSSLAISTQQQNAVSSANKIAVFQFILPYSQTVTNIILDIQQADGSNNSDVGIYDTSGNLKCHAGAQHFGSTGVQTFAMTGVVTLSAGTYLLAFTSVATTMRWTGIAIDQALSAGIFYYSTATTSSGGTLPSSITVSASASGTNSNLELRSANSNLPLFMIT